ncbi:MAG: hypothetical protein V3U75_11670 [Methylococcaceae bacterium]
MTRRKEKNLITAACLSIILAIVVFGFMGCGTLQDVPTETKVVLTYESMGAVLETALPTLQGLCSTGTMSAEDCIEAKMAYNEAVAIYKFLGDAAILAVDTGDYSSFKIMATRLMKLLNQLQAYGG